MVMPNHFHGILITGEPHRRGAACRAPTLGAFGPPIPGALSTIVRSLKAAATKRINELRGTRGLPLWQRNYYERIIRNEDDLIAIRRYILDNPACWAEDEDNPARRMEDDQRHAAWNFRAARIEPVENLRYE